MKNEKPDKPLRRQKVRAEEEAITDANRDLLLHAFDRMVAQGLLTREQILEAVEAFKQSSN